MTFAFQRSSKDTSGALNGTKFGSFAAVHGIKTAAFSVEDSRSPMSDATPNRWRIPIGAVLVHICIGSVYAWSTFNRPIQALFPDQPWWFSPPYTTFTTALVLLGLSAAFGGPWVERRGPRVAATAAALFFGTGLLIGGVGLAMRQPVLVFLGMGVIGGIGCGLGYISPVSTLVKWFPDRRGMATGMAIMGFGGGAFLAGYLNVFFMDRIGVANTVMALGATYLVDHAGRIAAAAAAAGRLAAGGLDAAGEDERDDHRPQRHAATRRSARRSSICCGASSSSTSPPASASSRRRRR